MRKMIDEEKVDEIVQYLIENPVQVRSLAAEMSARIKNGIHENTAFFWSVISRIEGKIPGNLEEYLKYVIENAVESKIVELENNDV